MPVVADERKKFLYDSPHLVVTGASASHILAMKLHAARQRDEEDKKRLMRRVGVRTMAGVGEVHRRVVRNEAGTPRCGRERTGCLPRNGSLPRVIFSAFTDHRITRQPIRSELTPSPRDLKAWKPLDGPIGRRNLRTAPT